MRYLTDLIVEQMHRAMGFFIFLGKPCVKGWRTWAFLLGVPNVPNAYYCNSEFQ